MRVSSRTFGLLDVMILIAAAAGALALQRSSTSGLLVPRTNVSRDMISFSLIQRGWRRSMSRS